MAMLTVRNLPDDVHRALRVLAAEHGRVGERYIISESYLPLRTILETAADETSVPPPRFGVPKAAMYAGAYATQPLRALRPGKIPPLVTITRLLHMTSPADNSKARRELGWEPEYTFERGNQFSGLAACSTCHGPKGLGTPQLPRLAGQHPRYIEDQLKQFNKRERTNDNAVMHTIASKLSELETHAVAEYISTLD